MRGVAAGDKGRAALGPGPPVELGPAGAAVRLAHEHEHVLVLHLSRGRVGGWDGQERRSRSGATKRRRGSSPRPSARPGPEDEMRDGHGPTHPTTTAAARLTTQRLHFLVVKYSDTFMMSTTGVLSEASARRLGDILVEAWPAKGPCQSPLRWPGEGKGSGSSNSPSLSRSRSRCSAGATAAHQALDVELHGRGEPLHDVVHGVRPHLLHEPVPRLGPKDGQRRERLGRGQPTARTGDGRGLLLDRLGGL